MHRSLLALAFWLPAATAVAQEMPASPGEFYAAGEQFAHCSAHFAFAAKMARDNGLSDSGIAFEGVERGWHLSGLFLLTQGLPTSRPGGVETLFATLQATKLDQIKAWRELNPANYTTTMRSEFDRECSPWVPLQKSIIASMRSAAASQ